MANNSAWIKTLILFCHERELHSCQTLDFWVSLFPKIQHCLIYNCTFLALKKEIGKSGAKKIWKLRIGKSGAQKSVASIHYGNINFYLEFYYYYTVVKRYLRLLKLRYLSFNSIFFKAKK